MMHSEMFWSGGDLTVQGGGAQIFFSMGGLGFDGGTVSSWGKVPPPCWAALGTFGIDQGTHYSN